jgi:hypothetical protein
MRQERNMTESGLRVVHEPREIHLRTEVSCETETGSFPNRELTRP